jgi:hypothetical protein
MQRPTYIWFWQPNPMKKALVHTFPEKDYYSNLVLLNSYHTNNPICAV